MNIDRFMFAFAGTMVLVSLALTHFVHPNFVWLTAFVGANLLQASFSGFCPVVLVLKKLGLKQGNAF